MVSSRWNLTLCAKLIKLLLPPLCAPPSSTAPSNYSPSSPSSPSSAATAAAAATGTPTATATATCSTCGDRSTPAAAVAAGISSIVTSLLAHNPVWQHDLKLEAGLGEKHSFLTFAAVDKQVREHIAAGQLEAAASLLRIAECFQQGGSTAGAGGGEKGWNTTVLRKTLERETRAAAVGSNEERSEGWYRLYRPVEGGPRVLVPT